MKSKSHELSFQPFYPTQSNHAQHTFYMIRIAPDIYFRSSNARKNGGHCVGSANEGTRYANRRLAESAIDGVVRNQSSNTAKVTKNMIKGIIKKSPRSRLKKCDFAVVRFKALEQLEEHIGVN